MSERAGRDDAVERLRSALDELTAHVTADPPDLLVGDTNERVVAHGNDRRADTDRRPRWRPRSPPPQPPWSSQQPAR